MLRKAINTIILMRALTEGAAPQRVTFKPGDIVDLSRDELDSLTRIDPECVTVLNDAEVALYEAQAAKAAPLSDVGSGELAPLADDGTLEGAKPKPKAKGKAKAAEQEAAPAEQPESEDDSEL